MAFFGHFEGMIGGRLCLEAVNPIDRGVHDFALKFIPFTQLRMASGLTF